MSTSPAKLSFVCPVCKSEDPRHSMDLEHGFMLVSEPGSPIALVINMQGVYDRSETKARLMAHVRAQMRQHFPGKEFEIQPSRLMLTKDGENSVRLGEAYVATYIAYEK